MNESSNRLTTPPSTFVVDLDSSESPVAVANSEGYLVAASPLAREHLSRAGVNRGTLPPGLLGNLMGAVPGVAVEHVQHAHAEVALSFTRFPLADGRHLIMIEDLSQKRESLRRRLHEQRMETLGRVATMFAPEIKNPLASVMLNADLLGSDDLDEADRREAVRDLQSAAQSMRQVVDDLLGFAGVMEPGKSQVAVIEVLDRVRSVLQVHHGEVEHRIQVGVTPGAELVQMHPRALEHILTSLGMNAFEAAGSQPVNVSFLASPAPGYGEWPMVRINVIDNGPGVPEERRGDLFEPFVSSKPGHLGLGLTLARELVRELGGELVLDPLMPTTFSVYIPGDCPPS